VIIRNETMIASSYVFWHVDFQSDKQEFSFRETKSKNICSHPKRNLL